MKNKNKLSIENIHTYTAFAVLICLSFLSLYIYAHSYVKNRFIDKLASRGIDAKVESISLKSEIKLSGIYLRVKDSNTLIKSITSDYWLTDIRVYDASINGKLEDYLELRASSNKKAVKKSAEKPTRIKLTGFEAQLNFRGRKINAHKLNFSTDDSIVKIALASVDDLIMENIDFDISANKAHIRKMNLIESQHKSGGNVVTKNIKPLDLYIPKLPNFNYEIYIDHIGESNAELETKGINIKIDYSDNFSLKVKGKKLKYKFYNSSDFSFEVDGKAASFNYNFSAKNNYLWHDKINTDVNNQKVSTKFNSIDINGNVIVSDDVITVKDGTLEVDKILMDYSFNFDEDIRDYNLSMPKTDCEQIMLANPFKDVFHNRCDSTHVDIGRCNAGNDTTPEDTDYSGIIEWSIAGKDISDLRFEFYSNCSFKSVPWYLKKARLNRPFALRVGEPLEKGDRWKPRREIMVGPGTKKWVPGNFVSYYLERALMVTEDGRFWFHKGIDEKAVSTLIKETVTSRKLNRGGSTITMQLAKNLWLMRKKTLSRKVEEFFLTLYLESIMSKAEIMQLYINVIEFGPDVYGIYDASQYYFKKVPFDLTLKESVFLASILPKPSANYFKGGKLGYSTNLKVNYLLETMFSRKLITKEELDESKLEILYNR